MRPHEMLQHAHNAGIRLSLRPETRDIAAGPREQITPELAGLIRENREAILTYLEMEHQVITARLEKGAVWLAAREPDAMNTPEYASQLRRWTDMLCIYESAVEHGRTT